MTGTLSEQQFMRYATDQTRLSNCTRRAVGCVIVREGQVITVGRNGTLPGTTACQDGGCERCADSGIPSGQQMEKCVCVHAEAHALGTAARYGIATNGAVAFVTHRPCTECAKLLVMAGIQRVFYLHDYPGTFAPLPMEQIHAA